MVESELQSNKSYGFVTWGVLMNQSLKQSREFNIGNDLKRLRKQSKMTQKDVCVQLQLKGFTVSRVVYAQMEMGKHHIPLEIMISLVDIFKTTYEELFCGLRSRVAHYSENAKNELN